MSQTYRIYINNAPLIITDNPLRKEVHMELLTNPGKKMMKKAIAALEKEHGHPGFCLLDKEVALAFQRFVQLHELVIAGGGLVIRDKKLLMIVRMGLWDLPKGKLEKKETTREGARREVKEECGLKDLALLEKAGVTYHVYGGKGERKLKRTHWYFATTTQEELIPQKEEKITHAEWLGADDVEEALEETYPNIRELVEKALPRLRV